jgi:hypothetical protein
LARRAADDDVYISARDSRRGQQLFRSYGLNGAADETRFIVRGAKRCTCRVVVVLARQYVEASLPETLGQTARAAKQIYGCQ